MLTESSASASVSLPPEQLFALLCQPRLRLQLAGDWGEYEFLGTDPDFPAPGSAYRLQLKQPQPAVWEIGVEACEPPYRLVFASRQGLGYRAVWQVEPAAGGSRLSLHEQCELPEPAAMDDEQTSSLPAKTDELEAFFKTADQTPAQVRQKLVSDWVAGIARYAGLPNSKLGRGWRWLMDRYLLRLRADQRRVILALLVMQVVLCLTFIASAVGLGVAGAILR